MIRELTLEQLVALGYALELCDKRAEDLWSAQRDRDAEEAAVYAGVLRRMLNAEAER